MAATAKQESGDYRAEVMRARLLDATLSVILEEGWAGASTTKICRKAQVSRGAQTHHFPTKTSLFMAAIEELARQSEAHILESMAKIEGEDRTVTEMLNLLWESMLDDRHLQTAMEAMIAARTDPELRPLIADLDARAVASMRSLAASLNVPGESIERVQDTVELSIYLFRSLVVERGMHNDAKFEGSLFEAWRDLVERAFRTNN